MTVAVTTKATEYKKACDEVLLGRAHSKKGRVAVKFQNGSSLAYLKSLRDNKHR